MGLWEGVNNVPLDINLHDDLCLLIASTVPCNTNALHPSFIASGYGGLQSTSDGLHSSSDGFQPTSDDTRSEAITLPRSEAIVFLRSEATTSPRWGAFVSS